MPLRSSAKQRGMKRGMHRGMNRTADQLPPSPFSPSPFPPSPLGTTDRQTSSSRGTSRKLGASSSTTDSSLEGGSASWPGSGPWHCKSRWEQANGSSKNGEGNGSNKRDEERLSPSETMTLLDSVRQAHHGNNRNYSPPSNPSWGSLPTDSSRQDCHSPPSYPLSPSRSPSSDPPSHDSNNPPSHDGNNPASFRTPARKDGMAGRTGDGSEGLDGVYDDYFDDIDSGHDSMMLASLCKQYRVGKAQLTFPREKGGVTTQSVWATEEDLSTPGKPPMEDRRIHRFSPITTADDRQRARGRWQARSPSPLPKAGHPFHAPYL
jgi:hypothetical protein